MKQKTTSINWDINIPTSNYTIRNMLMNSRHFSDYQISFTEDIMNDGAIHLEHSRDHWRVDLNLEDFIWAIREWTKTSRRCLRLIQNHRLYLSDLSYKDNTYIVDLAIEHHVNFCMKFVRLTSA